MLLTLTIIALNLSLGIYLFISFRSAPEGYEDETGFNFKNKREPAKTYEFYDAFADRQPKQGKQIAERVAV